VSTRIAWDREEDVAVLYDSVTGIAFGQVFEGEESYEEAERFLGWLPLDAGTYAHEGLVEMRRRFADVEADARKPDGIPVRKDVA
jgi:hypothetical protein